MSNYSSMPDSSREDLEELSFICMDCGKDCKTYETVYTGAEETLRGWEIWCYCRECDVETFHPIKLKTK